MANEPWKFEEPLCAEVGIEIFFVKDRDEIEPGEETHIGDYQSAISICKRCKHLTECADWGIRNEAHGVWGGTTPHQRKVIRSRLNITLFDKVI